MRTEADSAATAGGAAPTRQADAMSANRRDRGTAAIALLAGSTVRRFALDLEPIDAFGIKAEMILDARALRQRRKIAPSDVLHRALAEPRRPIGGLALVGTDRACRGRR